MRSAGGYFYEANGSQAVTNFGEPKIQLKVLQRPLADRSTISFKIGPIALAIWLPAADAPARANVPGSELSLMFAR